MSTFIRQCCVCHAVFNPGTKTWDAHDKVIAVATHTYCGVCAVVVKKQIEEELEYEKQLSGN
jgi:hypothetical protein